MFRDSTEERPSRGDEEEEEMDREGNQRGGKETGSSRRIPRMDSSFKVKSKSRHKSTTEGGETGASEAPMSRSRSLRFPSQLGHAFRKVLPTKSEKGERSESSTPGWLQALKPKKKK
ncbi:182 kDa tankyrase-1-binding protein-like [Hypanus sabinus]|nr:182 kDa tankyrase-1-binding protein-like [Hypanus sabinus]